MKDVDGQAGSARGPSDQLSDDSLAESVKAAFRLISVPKGYKDRTHFLEALLSPAFLRVKETLCKYDPDRGIPLEHFIYGVVRTLVQEVERTERRKQIREANVSMKDLGDHIRSKIEIETPRLDKFARDLEWIYEVVNLIATPRQRRISELRGEGYSFKEIANQLDVTENVACQDMGRLKKKMVEWFADELKTPRESVVQWIDRLHGSLDYDPIEKQERSSP